VNFEVILKLKDFSR